MADLSALAGKLGGTWPARFAMTALSALALPGDVYAGRTSAGSPEMYDRAADLAGIMVGAPGGAGGLGSGVRGPLSFSERMDLGKAIAMEQANRGRSVGNYGMSGNRNAPAPTKGSFDDLAGRVRSGWNDDKAAALDAFRDAAGVKPEAKTLLAPGESLDDLAAGFNLGSGQTKQSGVATTKETLADIFAPYAKDKTAIGDQSVIPGAERASDATMAQRATDAPLKAKVAQKAADLGLFSDDAKQTDMFSVLSGK